MMKQLSDLELITNIKSGDVLSFEELVNRHKKFAYKVAYNVLRIHEDAEEVAHDAFVKVYTIIKDFKGDSKFTTWFYRIVLNMAIGKTRKKKLVTEDIFDPNIRLGQQEFQEASNDLQNIERKKYIDGAMANLNDEERALLGLYYFKELSLEEMTEITGLTTNTMKVKIFRARKKMAKHLENLLPNEVASIY
ncbi:MAG: sigma-70 family RNA polymerase sigma factor [Reichenbachiella sp.]